MFVGVARLVLQIPGARSLKDRRQVVKSCKERMRARLQVSISEVGDVERYQVASIGLVTVARQSGRVRSVLSQAVEMAGSLPDAVLADVRTEILSFGDGGEGITGGIEESGVDRPSPEDVDQSDLAEKWGRK
jgi:uncharacterized protein YlxP (DUF503 family)